MIWVGPPERQVESEKPIERKTREDVIAVLGELIDDYTVNDDSWENPRLGMYLEAMHAWLIAWGNKYDPEPSWEFIIDLLEAAKIYE